MTAQACPGPWKLRCLGLGGSAVLAALGAGCSGPVAGEAEGEQGPSSNPPPSTSVPAKGDIGVSPMGRLNRLQYNNTVRDLLGTEQTPADSFPRDELALGFDTIGSVLRVQPEHIEAYLSAATTLMDEFFSRDVSDPIWQRYVDCDLALGASCQTQALKNFATAAWRRPASDQEIKPYVALAQTQTDPASGLYAAMRAVLTSSKFIFRIELDPDPDDVRPHVLSAYELATRLSYFIGSTTPDAELLDAASDGSLIQTSVLSSELERLYQDPTRRDMLVRTFGSQWLNVNGVHSSAADPEMFPLFSQETQDAMVEETQRFVSYLLFEAVPVSTLLTADFTYVDSTLASHYGLSPVSDWQRVSTQDTNRGGLLTMGSYLLTTSNPTRTSPVKRGLYVLDRLLCSAPPPPPPDVDLNIDEGMSFEGLSMRERLQQHQLKGPACASCHKVMDAIGLGLENFDAVGQYREADEFGTIDPSGELPSADGAGTTAFSGPSELASLLAQDVRLLPCATRKLMTFGLGRTFKDPQLVAGIAEAAAEHGASLSAVVQAIVQNELFSSRRAALPEEVQ